MGKTLNLFVVESRFQALVALMIARSQPDSHNIVFYFLETIGDFTRQFPFVQSVYLGDRITHGIWKKPRTLKRQVNTLIAAAKSHQPTGIIHYHCANLKTPLLNYPIHALQKHFPQATMSVNILTDGTSNFQRRNLSDKAQRKLQKLAKRPVHRLLGMRFTLFNRERFGIDADIIRKIYLLPGAPHQYDTNRVVDMPIVDLGLPASGGADGDRRALVIGEKLTERHWLSTTDEQRISADVARLIRNQGITAVDYVPHPTATQLDLWQTHYTRVTTQNPIELRIMQHRYELICGIASTALFTARLLQPEGGRTVSVGLPCLTGRNALAGKIGEAFAGMGVERYP